MDSSNDTGCQASEGPVLCVNNCGFFGSATTLNMCSKCHKEMILKHEQTKLAVASIENIVNGSSSTNEKEPCVTVDVNVHNKPIDFSIFPGQVCSSFSFGQSSEVKAKEGPNRCTSCRKRVGLTGFNCKCGNLYCAMHRYSDKHDCPFDYRSASREAIATANPVVKAEKLDKI